MRQPRADPGLFHSGIAQRLKYSGLETVMMGDSVGLHVLSRKCAFSGHDFGQFGHPTPLRCILVLDGAIARDKLIVATSRGMPLLPSNWRVDRDVSQPCQKVGP